MKISPITNALRHKIIQPEKDANEIISQFSREIPLPEIEPCYLKEVEPAEDHTEKLQSLSPKNIIGAICFLTSFSLTTVLMMYFTKEINMPVIPSSVISFTSIGILPLLINAIFETSQEENSSSSFPNFA